MRQQHLYALLVTGVFMVAALVASWSAAQDGSGGYGNVPPGPGAPGGPGSINQPVVPLPPVQPPATSRPSSWPGGPTGGGHRKRPPAGGLPPGEMRACNGSRIVAYVGSEVILESDLILRKVDKRGTFEIVGSVDHVFEEYKEQYPPDQLDAQREMLIAKLLPEVIEIKLIYLDAKQTIPSEHWSDVEKQLDQGVRGNPVGKDDEAIRSHLARRTRSEAPHRGHVGGTREAGVHRVRAGPAMAGAADQARRGNHLGPDGHPIIASIKTSSPSRPRAKWEELMVRFSKYPTEAAAWDAIARMGNQVLAGVPFAEVARAGSDGVGAANGGQRDWTAKGSLVPGTRPGACSASPSDSSVPPSSGAPSAFTSFA